MKLRFIFLSILFVAAGQISAKDSKLTVLNDYYGPVSVTLYESTSKNTSRETRSLAPSGEFVLAPGKSKVVKLRDLGKKVTRYVWVELEFQNGARFYVEKVIEMPRDKEVQFNITKDIFLMPKTSSNEKNFEELRAIFYSDITILEQAVENKKEQFLSLFGGLAIVKIDTVSGEKNRLNLMESKTLGRSVITDGDVFTENNIRNHDYIFKDSFLYKELKGRKNLIPGIQPFAKGLQQKGHLFQIHYTIKGLDNYINYQDETPLQERWFDIRKDFRNIFLEDYISAIERKGGATKIEVREYNRASGFQFMQVEIDEYGPFPGTDDKRIKFVTEQGPFYLVGQEVYQDLMGNQILALGYDDSGVNHTEWVHEKALAYLDELIKQRKPKTGSYLDMLNKLGIQGFSSLDQNEYITTLKNIKADLLGEYE